MGRNQEGDYCGKICQDGPPSENCEARREAIEIAKNPTGIHKGHRTLWHDLSKWTTRRQVRRKKRRNQNDQKFY